MTAERATGEKRAEKESKGVPGEFTAVKMLTCPDGHDYPESAGECPFDGVEKEFIAQATEQVDQSHVPQLLRDFVASDIVQFLDNGNAPRTGHDYGYKKKIGLVNHIPVCKTLKQLTDYFNGGNAQGSTHFGIGRDQTWNYRIGTVLIPCADIHQYMPLYGVSPWAQGVIANPTSPTVMGLRSGEPNGAFHSVENVAMSGADGVTDAQFNSNVFIRAYCASLDGYGITPLTQLWHAEIDAVNRPNDPGWPGELEDAMQYAALRLQVGDLIGLRGTWTDVLPPPPPPPPPPSGAVLEHRGTQMRLDAATGEYIIETRLKVVG